MKRRFFLKTVFALILAMCLGAASAAAAPWKFGVMSDTQWTVPNDGKNPDTVAVGMINRINTEFILADVDFVVQVGDLEDTFSAAAMDTRASAAQALYDAGIGFYPLRGNHESSMDAALRFQTDFPQTQGSGSHLFGASNFSSTGDNLKGLSYSFDYRNARFVLLDQFTRTDGTGSTNTNIVDQLGWISTRLSTRRDGSHAFVFSHKNLIGENHTDVLFGANPSSNPAAQNSFIDNLFVHGVRYAMSGHDHVHQRSIIASPDGTSKVQQIIGASDSSKFYIPLGNPELPGTVNNDVKYDNPTREVSIAQERYTVGYYIFTVDGPRVVVDYYSSPVPAVNDGGEYLIYITPNLAFARRETFGYSLNGKEFLVAQGRPYTVVQDSHFSTTARILGGINGSGVKDGSNRPLVKAVDTGWTPGTAGTHKAECGTASDILSLWGMADLGTDQTDVFALSLTYDPRKAPLERLGKGLFGLATKDDRGNWINAVDRNFGGTKKFVRGAWKPGYGLGTYGVDPATKTAWAVINHNSDFAVASHEKQTDGMDDSKDRRSEKMTSRDGDEKCRGDQGECDNR
jgi:hypothetical protein